MTYSFPTALALAALPVTLFLVPPRSPAPAPSTMKVSGTFTMSIAQAQQLDMPDAPGHMLLAAKAQGTNDSPGSYLDNGEITMFYTADLTQGNGPHQGYNVEVYQGGDTTIARWNGSVKTVLAQDKKTPMTSFEGTWTKIRGTGKAEGVTGAGTYKGYFTSLTDYTVNWQGELTLPKERTASR